MPTFDPGLLKWVSFPLFRRYNRKIIRFPLLESLPINNESLSQESRDYKVSNDSVLNTFRYVYRNAVEVFSEALLYTIEG